MTKELFDVCLTGQLLTGHNRREVAVNLAQLVGTSIAQADTLLSAASCVKSGIDRQTAVLYHEILEETGAQAVIRACLSQSDSTPRPAPVPPSAPPPPVAASVQTDPDQPILPEATPLLEAVLALPGADTQNTDDELPDQDTTQPFATPLPAPLRRQRRARRGLILLLAGVSSAALAAYWFWPTPPAPGAAMPRVGESLNLVQPLQQQVELYWQRQGYPPMTGDELGWQGAQPLAELARVELQAEGVLLLTFSDQVSALEGRTLLLRPAIAEQGYAWDCTGGTLPPAERPAECRAPAAAVSVGQ